MSDATLGDLLRYAQSGGERPSPLAYLDEPAARLGTSIPPQLLFALGPLGGLSSLTQQGLTQQGVAGAAVNALRYTLFGRPAMNASEIWDYLTNKTFINPIEGMGPPSPLDAGPTPGDLSGR